MLSLINIKGEIKMLLTKIYEKLEKTIMDREFIIILTCGILGTFMLSFIFSYVFTYEYGYYVNSVHAFVVTVLVGFMFAFMVALDNDFASSIVSAFASSIIATLIFCTLSALIELSQNIKELVIVLIAVLIISEIFYWLDQHKWKNLTRWENTLAKKGECLLETSLIIVNSIFVIRHFNDFIDKIVQNTEAIIQASYYVAITAVAIIAIVVYLYLNSLKYKEK